MSKAHKTNLDQASSGARGHLINNEPGEQINEVKELKPGEGDLNTNSPHQLYKSKIIR